MPIAVIGAGACGLVAAKKLLDQGLNVVVYEENPALGGNWRFGAPGSAVYRSTHFISSKRMTEFRDFPMPDDWPPYIGHAQALDYLESYADRFGLLPHIRFGTKVAHATHRAQSGWRIETAEGGSGLPVLYKNLFHPKLRDLFFLGLIQPNSGLWFLAELQAELVARALAAPAPRLAAAIEDRQATGYFNYLKSPRHHLEVDYYRYQRDLERLLRLAPGRTRRTA